MPNSFTGYNQVTTLEYNGIPDLYSPNILVEGERWTQATYYWYEDWFGDKHPSRPQNDYVFWLYKNSGYGWDYDWTALDWSSTRVDVEVHIPPFSNFQNNMHVIPHTAVSSFNTWNSVPRNDNLFSEGQVGLRIISNRWKYAPWERYPHLV